MCKNPNHLVVRGCSEEIINNLEAVSMERECRPLKTQVKAICKIRLTLLNRLGVPLKQEVMVSRQGMSRI